jgi:hypothetical protein
VLPSKLYVVQTLDGILCISLIIHVHKCKTCAKMKAFATELLAYCETKNSKDGKFVVAMLAWTKAPQQLGFSLSI